MRRMLFIAMIITFVILVVGCSGEGPPTPGQADHPFPMGLIEQLDINLVFNEGGTWSVYHDTHPAIEEQAGTYQLNGDQITISTTRGDCIGQGEGLYRWQYFPDEGRLTIKVLSDSCGQRSAFFALPNWAVEEK